MRKLERDRRGFPIFATVYCDAAGRPHFTVSDEAKRQWVIRNDRCALCGDKLLRGRWLIGGPLSAFHERGTFTDPPMHDDCAHYALLVCPYLATPNYSKRLDLATVPTDEHDLIVTDHAVVIDRPAVFVAIMFVGKPLWIEGGVTLGHQTKTIVRHVKPRRPF